MILAGEGNHSRRRQQNGQGGNHRGCGGWKNNNVGRAMAPPDRRGDCVSDLAQCYAFLNKSEVEVSDAMIICAILVCD